MSDFSIHRSWSRARGQSEADATMCELRIVVADRTITEYREEHGTSVEHLEIPVYYLAEWIAENWWPLLWEPRKNEEAGDAGDNADFLARHSILTAQHGFALPNLTIVPTGKHIQLSSSPRFVQFAEVQFTKGGNRSVPRHDAEAVLAEFVGGVVHRLHEKKIDGTSLQEEWHLVLQTSDEEKQFCRYMGALGLSPYLGEAQIEGALERLSTIFDDRLLMDLCLAVTAEEFLHASGYAQRAMATASNAPEANLDPLLAIEIPSENYSVPAHRRGARSADRVRSRLRIQDTDPRGSTKLFDELRIDPSRSVFSSEDQVRDETHVVGAVQRDGSAARLALLQRTEAQRRFVAARAAFSAWDAAHPAEGRFLTQAVTRDQQASRAFGAEIMVPRAYLKRHAKGHRLSWDQVYDLAGELGATPDLVRKHAENNGLTIVSS